MRTPGLLCCIAIAGCTVAPTAPIGLNPRIVDRGIEASFNAEVAPAIASSCTAEETATLRSVMLDMARAINTVDVSGLQGLEARTSGISAACGARFKAVTQDLCARNAARNASIDTPAELTRARIAECYR